MKNEIMFGMLTVAIVAVAAAALTTVLDDMIQDADAKPQAGPQPGGTGPPPGQGNQGGGNQGNQGQPGPPQ